MERAVDVWIILHSVKGSLGSLVSNLVVTAKLEFLPKNRLWPMIFFILTFRGPCIVIYEYSYNKTKEMH